MNTDRCYLTGACVVLPGETLEDAAVLIEDGVIAAVNPASSGGAREVDLAGRMLLPGLVDLHCDALEKEVEPRPNVRFPLDFACAQADKRNATAGVTTVYHALSFANAELGVRNNETAASVARAVRAWRPHALVDNRVHCRYEVTDETAPPALLDLLEHDDMHLLSFMDHTPGQGQFKDIGAYRDYVARTYKTSEAEINDILARKLAAAAGSVERVQMLAAKARGRGVAVASHDDDSPQRVETMAALGATISEFPVNLETAQAAKAKGIATLYGAPNVLRGKSQSGSMRALDAVLHGVADCLCGDYSPAALLPSVLKLPTAAGLSLSAAVQLVTANPARAAGLTDRGEIAIGRRADLVAVKDLGGLPQVERVWVRGVLVYRAFYDHA
jgi:alpha-D-ribose 1-methylphosphonate 5-triphosphate diphosphatase